jgi:hypothetical protein
LVAPDLLETLVLAGHLEELADISADVPVEAGVVIHAAPDE